MSIAHRENGSRGRRTPLWGKLASTTALVALWTIAGETGSATAAEKPDIPATELAQAASRVFDIQAQPLAGALTAFGQQSGLQVSVDSAILTGITSPGVNGALEPEQALGRLLAGTGIIWYATDAKTVVLEKPTAEGALMLGPVTVEGGISATSTIGQPPPAYPGGQVARGARLGALGNRDVFDVPFSVTPFTRDLIDNQQARTVVEVLRNDPSITINQNANAGGTDDVFNIRGFLSSSFATTFDGLPGLNFRQPSLEQIERVELFKGPNAFLNGSAGFLTVGGVVNLAPKRATDEPVTDVTARYLSDSLFGGHADVGRRYGSENQFGIRFNGAYREGDTAVDQIRKRNEVAALALDYRGETFRWTGDVDYNYNVTDGFMGGMELAGGFQVPKAPRNTTLLTQPWTVLSQDKTRVASRAEWDFIEDWTASIAAGQLDVEERYNHAGAILLNDLGDLAQDVYTGASQTRNRTAEALVRGRFDTFGLKHTLSFGTSWLEQKVGSIFVDLPDLVSNMYRPVYVASPSFPGLSIPDRTSLTTTRSYFVGDEVSMFGDRVILTAGGRKTEIKTGNYDAATGARTSGYDNDAITPAVGILVKPLQNVSVYANYMEALESGDTAPDTAVNRGETLEPLVSEQVEAGVKVDFGSLGATFAAFRISRANAFTDPVTNVYGNNGEQVNRGLEFSAFGEPLDGVRVLGGVTLIDAETTKTLGGTFDGNRPIGVPTVQARLSAEWDLPAVEGLTVSGGLAFTGRQYADSDNTQEIPSWTRVDLGLRYVLDVRQTPVTVRFNVENLFDRDYWASVDRGSLYVGGPRTFLLSTTVSF